MCLVETKLTAKEILEAREKNEPKDKAEAPNIYFIDQEDLEKVAKENKYQGREFIDNQGRCFEVVNYHYKLQDSHPLVELR